MMPRWISLVPAATVPLTDWQVGSCAWSIDLVLRAVAELAVRAEQVHAGEGDALAHFASRRACEALASWFGTRPRACIVATR